MDARHRAVLVLSFLRLVACIVRRHPPLIATTPDATVIADIIAGSARVVMCVRGQEGMAEQEKKE